MFIQNQRGAGKLAKRWERTGTVVGDKTHDKYAFKVDGVTILGGGGENIKLVLVFRSPEVPDSPPDGCNTGRL